MTVIGFNIWCSVPNLIKIGRFFTEIWRYNDFQNGGRPPSWILKSCSLFLSCGLCRHAVLLPQTKFRRNRTIGWWVMAKKSDFEDNDRHHLEFQKFQFLVTSSLSDVVYQISSKSGNFLLRYGDLTMFKMAVVRHLGFYIFAFLFRSPCQHAVLLPHTKFRWNRTIGWWVMAKKTIFKMAAAAILNFKNFNFWSRDCHWVQYLL